MTTTIHVGKARVFDFSITAGGSPDVTTAATADGSVPTVLRATVNPSNIRQLGVVALAVGTTNANVHCGPITLHALVNVVAAVSAPPPDGGSIDEAGVGPEVDPSTIPWA